VKIRVREVNWIQMMKYELYTHNVMFSARLVRRSVTKI
jgi:hypothetical protein